MRNLKRNFASPTRREDEMTVQSGLSLTPRDMDKMLQQGQPISTANLPDNQFYDGDTNPSFDIPMDQRKGIDPADLWEFQRAVYKKANDARKANGPNLQPKNSE